MHPNNWYSVRGFHNYSRWNTNKNSPSNPPSAPSAPSLTILRYNAAQTTQPATSFMWGSVEFTLDTTLPNYSYTSRTTSIPESVVPGKNALSQVTIGNSVTRIGVSAFQESALTSITFTPTSTLKSIGRSAFTVSALTSITIPDSVTSIEKAAFWNIDNLSITFTPTSTLQSIGEEAFQDSGLQSITIPNSVTNIGANAFQYTGLRTVTISRTTANALSISGSPIQLFF